MHTVRAELGESLSKVSGRNTARHTVLQTKLREGKEKQETEQFWIQ